MGTKCPPSFVSGWWLQVFGVTRSVLLLLATSKLIFDVTRKVLPLLAMSKLVFGEFCPSWPRRNGVWHDEEGFTPPGHVNMGVWHDKEGFPPPHHVVVPAKAGLSSVLV